MKFTFLEFMYSDWDPVTQSELDSIERYLDNLFADANVDIEFTKHFLDRVNDTRNKKQITASDIIRVYKDTYEMYKDEFENFGDNFKALLKHLNTDINIPFVLEWNPRSGKYEMVAKTIMRKKNFKTYDYIMRV